MDGRLSHYSQLLISDDGLPNIVRDFRLATEIISPDCTYHSYYYPDKGGRAIRAEEVWQRQRKLGAGSYGAGVWLELCIQGRPGEQGRLRVVKEMPKSNMLQSQKDIIKELEVSLRFSQRKYRPWFVRSYGWWDRPDSVLLAMEYAVHGNLKSYLQHPLVEDEARDICEQVLNGLNSLHRHRYAHRDLRPENVLVFQAGPQWWVKVGDFGVSKNVPEPSSFHTVDVITGYMAPELLGIYSSAEEEAAYGPYSPAVDLWSLGQLTIQMMTGRTLFQYTQELLSYVVRGEPFPVAELQEAMVSETCQSFILGTMARSPSARLTTERAISHQWLLARLEVPSLSPHSPPCSPTSSLRLGTIGEGSVYPGAYITLSPRDPSREGWDAGPVTSPSRRSFSGLTPRNSLVRLDDEQIEDCLGVGAPWLGHPVEAVVTFEPANPNLDSFRLKHTFPGRGPVCFSPDGSLIIHGTQPEHSYIAVREAETWGAKHHLKDIRGTLDMVEFSMDGRWIAVTGYAESSFRRVYRRHSSGATLVRHREKTRPEIKHTADPGVFYSRFSADSRYIATFQYSRSRILTISALEGDEPPWVIPARELIHDVKFSPDGRKLAIASGRLVQLYDITSWSTTSYLTIHTNSDCLAMEFSPDSRLLAIERMPNPWSIQLLDSGTGSLVKELAAPQHCHLDDLAFSPNGKWLLAGASSRESLIGVCAWEIEKGELVYTLDKRDAGVRITEVAFAPNGRQIVCAPWLVKDEETFIEVWDVPRAISD